MRYTYIDPPGTILGAHALVDLVKKRSKKKPKRFVDIGCGRGTYSAKLIEWCGTTGVGLEPSEPARVDCREFMAPYMDNKRFSVCSDSLECHHSDEKYDLGVCWCVIEHIEDEIPFLQKCKTLIEPGGQFYVAVPARMDLWGIEDETAGHYRRYTRSSLKAVLEKAGFEDVEVISANVPVSNVLMKLSNYFVGKHETHKKSLSKDKQTETSGVRKIKWKTIYPAWIKVFLNDKTMYPLRILQRLFYNTDRGTIIIAAATVPKDESSE